jgi:hypothetical protein
VFELLIPAAVLGFVAYKGGMKLKDYLTLPATPATQEAKLASIDPKFRPFVDRIFAILRGQGYQPYLVNGWRNPNTQAGLKASGASTVLFSLHNATKNGKPSALAVDIANGSGEGNSEAFYAALGRAAEGIGMTWGGSWTGFRDLPHVQMGGVSLPRDPGEARRKFLV